MSTEDLINDLNNLEADTGDQAELQAKALDQAAKAKELREEIEVHRENLKRQEEKQENIERIKLGIHRKIWNADVKAKRLESFAKNNLRKLKNGQAPGGDVEKEAN